MITLVRHSSGTPSLRSWVVFMAKGISELQFRISDLEPWNTGVNHESLAEHCQLPRSCFICAHPQSLPLHYQNLCVLSALCGSILFASKERATKDTKSTKEEHIYRTKRVGVFCPFPSVARDRFEF